MTCSSAEVLADLKRTQVIASALAKLGYSALESARFFQWRRQIVIGHVSQEIKFDLLVAPIDQFKDRLKVKEHRVRPKGEVQLHAYHTKVAIEIEEDPMPVSVTGQRSNGESYEDTAFVPLTFPYLMMKLHAFDDRKADDRKDVGRHHALDLYTIVGLMTEAEYKTAIELGSVYRERDNPYFEKARQIVIGAFSGLSALGIIRLREHPLYEGISTYPCSWKFSVRSSVPEDRKKGMTRDR